MAKEYQLSYTASEIDEKLGTVEILQQRVTNIETNISKSTVIDLTAYESDGTIVETYADGSTITYTMEFDTNGHPTKVTDSKGNVTELIW